VGEIRVRDLLPADRGWASELIAGESGGRAQVARLGELIDPLTLEGLVAEEDGHPSGLATVMESAQRGLEVLTLHARPRGRGAGSALLETAWHVAAASGHHRLWLVTTSDNTDAIHFYLRRGMHVAVVHAAAVADDRALKPEIPKVNPTNGLPIRDLVEFELTRERLSDHLVTVGFPDWDDLNRLPHEAFGAELRPLFEGGDALLAGLAALRPFETDEDLVRTAFEVAHTMAEAERVQLVEAHPRIGAPPESVSSLSFDEQGYAAEEPDDEGAQRADAELAMLNEIYEQRFGFRYVVFVAGRPRAAIVPLLERALRNDREVELRRAVDETIYIAGDRLLTLRGTREEEEEKEEKEPSA
jgi:2-oxo-4-hydroxy-4-carboxy-5-ureidoimidazoline decarboxylase